MGRWKLTTSYMERKYLDSNKSHDWKRAPIYINCEWKSKKIWFSTGCPTNFYWVKVLSVQCIHIHTPLILSISPIKGHQIVKQEIYTKAKNTIIPHNSLQKSPDPNTLHSQAPYKMHLLSCKSISHCHITLHANSFISLLQGQILPLL